VSPTRDFPLKPSPGPPDFLWSSNPAEIRAGELLSGKKRSDDPAKLPELGKI
jgi:hypothetical protein